MANQLLTEPRFRQSVEDSSLSTVHDLTDSPTPFRVQVFGNKVVWGQLSVLLALATFLCFYNLGDGAEWGSYTAVDESRHIRVAQEMRLSGRWWYPTLEGEPYFLKPPFKMWLTMIPATLLGESNFSYRVLDGFLGVGLVLMTYGIAAFLFRNPASGFLSALLLLGNRVFFFEHGVRSAVQDTMMLFLTTIAMILGWLFVKGLDERRDRRGHAVRGGVCIGLAALTKSIAAYYPFGVLGALCALDRGGWNKFKRAWKSIVATSCIALAIPALYYVPHLILDPAAYRGAVDHEIVGRLLERGYHNPHKDGYYIHLIRSGVIISPWPLLFASIYFVIRGICGRSREHLFVFLWAALPLAVFSALPSRLSWYLGPCFIPFALMVGESMRSAVDYISSTIDRFFQLPWRKRFYRAILLICSFAFVAWTAIDATRAIVTVGGRVSEARERLPFDLLVEEMLKELRVNPEQRVLAFDLPELASNERVYMNMLRPYLLTVADRDRFEEALQGPNIAFAMTSATTAKYELGRKEQLKYAVLGANGTPQEYGGKKRSTPIVVFAMGDGEAQNPRFNLSKATFQLTQLPPTAFLHGWAQKPWGNRARMTLGEGSGFFVPADPLMEHAGVLVKIKLARDGAGTDPELRTTVLINSKTVGQIEPVPLNFESFEYLVPPGIVRAGEKNLIQLLASYPNNREIPLAQKSLLVESVTLQALSLTGTRSAVAPATR